MKSEINGHMHYAILILRGAQSVPRNYTIKGCISELDSFMLTAITEKTGDTGIQH